LYITEKIFVIILLNGIPYLPNIVKF